MASPQPADVLGRVILVTGPEEFLAERAVGQVRDAVRRHDAEAELGETTADQLTMATLGELAAPSLFSSTRCVVVGRLEDLPEESVTGMLAYVDAPADDVALVLVHSGGQKGSGLLTKLRKAGSVTEVKTAPLKGREFQGFVVNELRNHRVRIDEDAAEHLVRAIGQDTRALASAASQLAADFNGQPLSLSMVKKYFAGRAEAKSFSIADAAMAGQAARALEELRWALDTGTAPVLVTSALAGSLRGLARLSSARRGIRDADLAQVVGVPPWKLRDLRQQARGWHGDGLARAIRVVARADADIKGQASDPSYALEKMVLDVVASRSAPTR
ncbi:DNA polymerase III subunit delta [Nocardioides terrisoli]|uniref:DNA polymerase III subunit delta n=1 Tax=Nocardioides terrisoli TaxID=3388267 RepID=UPI00287B6C6E|nr:DNA polymerase III subunit delta [Nocardioides marmorisolisilvae]